MATFTTNYNLKKPAASDFVDVEDFNDNADIIDAELKKRAELDDDGKVKSEQLPEISFDPTAEIEAAIREHNESNTAHDDLRVLIAACAEKPLIGTSAPTASTVGVVGQQYIDKTNKRVWYCTAASATSYTWISPDKDLADSIATKQNASTAVNTSNIGSQTVNKAKYATDTIAVGTPALRNEYFVSAEATPTVNGQIAWVYG